MLLVASEHADAGRGIATRAEMPARVKASNRMRALGAKAWPRTSARIITNQRRFIRDRVWRRCLGACHATTRLSRLALRVLVEPAEHFLVPQLAVLRLEDPVVLVGEVDEPARHALALQSGERRHALRVDHAVVERTVDDERRRLPVLHEIDRV